MKTYVIGDIHGMLNKLEKLLDKIPFNTERDCLAFIGDYIDRGPNSREVVDRVLRLMDESIKTICLKGNHEWMWQEFLEKRDPLPFLLNGGLDTIQSYREGSNGQDSYPPEHHLIFLRNLLPYYEAEHFILVHGGLRPGIPLEKQRENDLYWIRFDFIGSNYDFGKKVIFGHTPFKRPYVDRYKIGIDTGAVFGNCLTCVCLPEVKFYSV
jgi:serine/threonine protein phosphatase 1